MKIPSFGSDRREQTIQELFILQCRQKSQICHKARSLLFTIARYQKIKGYVLRFLLISILYTANNIMDMPD